MRISTNGLNKHAGETVTLEKDGEHLTGRLYGEIQPFNYLGFLSCGEPPCVFTDERPFGRKRNLYSEDTICIAGRRYEVFGTSSH